jgi:hypothetical protein
MQAREQQVGQMGLPQPQRLIAPLVLPLIQGGIYILPTKEMA